MSQGADAQGKRWCILVVGLLGRCHWRGKGLEQTSGDCAEHFLSPFLHKEYGGAAEHPVPKLSRVQQDVPRPLSPQTICSLKPGHGCNGGHWARTDETLMPSGAVGYKGPDQAEYSRKVPCAVLGFRAAPAESMC